MFGVTKLNASHVTRCYDVTRTDNPGETNETSVCNKIPVEYGVRDGARLRIRNIASAVARRSEIKYRNLLEPRLNLSDGRKVTKASTKRQVAVTSVNPRNGEVHYGVQQGATSFISITAKR